MLNTKTSTLVLRLLFVAMCVVFIASNVAISAESAECPLPDSCGIDEYGNPQCIPSEGTYTCSCPGGTAFCQPQFNLWCAGGDLYARCVSHYACRCF